MAFLRKQTSEGSIGLLYSIIQKCIRRGLEEEALYYSNVIYTEATKNSLRKRLIYVSTEDIGNLRLSEEILLCKDEDLLKYLVICCRMKKTHDPAWLSRLALHYCMNKLETDNEELQEAMKLTEFVKIKDYDSIRKYLGSYKKMYAFSGKNHLIWTTFILFNRRPELNQEYSLNDINLEEINPKKFPEVPFWVKDKHVAGGTKGYKFFFDNSLVVNEGLYEVDKFAEETKKVYLDDEKNLGNGKTKVLYKKWLGEDLEDSLDEYEKKISGFKDVIQIQLITSKGKPPVYFVTSLQDGEKYVLKGPMKMDMRNQIMKTENLKKELGLNHLNVEFINIFNQNWMKSDSLLDYDITKKVLKTSKLETNVYIYSGENSNVSFDDLNDDNFLKIIEQYLFRLLTGANDHCARNFIKKDDIVYSIDDHSLEEDIKFNEIKMKKSIKEIWNKNIIKFRKEILNKLFEWYLLTTGTSKLEKRIRFIMMNVKNFVN